MKRRGFLINYAVVVLLIPLLLLLATYEDVSSYVIQSQGKSVEIERTYDVISYLTLDFQNALEIAGKRAVVSAVDYVVTTGKFIPPTYRANEFIKEMVIYGHVLDPTPFDPNGLVAAENLMKGQSLGVWIGNITKKLREQGYILLMNLSNINLTVAPLDSFHIVLRARLTNVTIKDTAGTVVYHGPIPNSGYVYAVINLQQIEDPIYAAYTGGRYHRVITACQYAFPQLGAKPLIWANGSGVSTINETAGIYGTDFHYNSTRVWDNNGDYVVNLTVGGLPANPLVLFNDTDAGVLVFSGVQNSQSNSTWCVASEYKVNMTLPSTTPLNDVVLIKIPTSSAPFGNVNHQDNRAAIRIYKAGTCVMAPYWIEYWGSDYILVWINTTNTTRYTVYYGNSLSLSSGDISSVFTIYTLGYWLGAGIEKSVQVFSNIPWTSFIVRYKAKGLSTAEDWDAGVGVDFRSTNNTTVCNYIKVTLLYPVSAYEYYYGTNPRVIYNFQLPIVLNSTIASMIPHNTADTTASIGVYSDPSLTQRVPFWIENWSDKGAKVWVKVNMTRRGRYYEGTVYLSCSGTEPLTRGNGSRVFMFFDNFKNSWTDKWIRYNAGVTISQNTSNNGTLLIGGGNSILALRTKNALNIDGLYAVHFRLKPNFTVNKDWDAGIALQDYPGGQIGFTDDIPWDYLAQHRLWWKYEVRSNSPRGDYLFHTYEVDMYAYGYSFQYRGYVGYFDFRDLTRSLRNPTDDWWYFKEPLEYIYLIIDSEVPYRGAVYDWIFIRKYLNLSYLDDYQTVYYTTYSSSMRRELEFIDDNPGFTDHGGDKLAILRNWGRNLGYYNGTWTIDTWHRYQAVVQAIGTSNNSRALRVYTSFYLDPDASGQIIVNESRSTGMIKTGTLFNVSAVIDNSVNNNATYEWIFVYKYPYTVVTPTFSSVENAPSSNTTPTSSNAHVYDLQPFINCLRNNRYFGIYGAWSFFERLEGSGGNHNYYWNLAKEMQTELKITYNGRYYPIGLVSFVIPNAQYDPAMFNLFQSLGLASTDEISVDYDFLRYYFLGLSSAYVRGYRVWGISHGIVNNGNSNLDYITFFMNYTLGEAFFGYQPSQDLIYSG